MPDFTDHERRSLAELQLEREVTTADLIDSAERALAANEGAAAAI